MFQENDGGRLAAGYSGSTGDCVTRAIAIVTGKSYVDVYTTVNLLGKQEKVAKGRSSARSGVYRQTYDKLLKQLGGKWHPCMGIGTGCKVHLNASELPKGRIIVKVSKHLVAMIDGVIHDTHDCSRGGTRCVYGYWTF